ncbi:MAG: diguanylate cyclase [Lachnospiraceae bacterium]|nr:diguanylate cyclase [Lachnospiraceae bacterium]
MRKQVAEVMLYIITAAMILLIIFEVLSSGSISPGDGDTEVSRGWYYMKDNEIVNVTLPATIDSDENELILYHNTLTQNHAGETLSTKAALYDLKIMEGDSVIYEYDDTEFPQNHQMAARTYCDAKLETEGNEVLALHYYNEGQGVFKLDMVNVGDSAAILKGHIMENAAIILIVFICLVFGVTTTGIFLFFYGYRIKEWRLLNIAEFLIICGIWVITDSALAQILGISITVASYCSFFAFMLMPIPMVAFVRHTAQEGEGYILDSMIAIYCLNLIIQIVLNYNHIFDFIDMLFVTHLLLAGGVILLVRLLIRNYKRNQDEISKTGLVAFTVLGGVGIIALILYWVLEISWYNLLFEIGIFVFVIILFCGTLKKVINSLRFQTERKAFERLSSEDRLTGLRNRKAYETYLEKLELSLDDVKDAWILYLELDHLKEINDEYGYNAGDEMVLNAARCIQNVFSLEGSCYRISGNEFCVILLNPLYDVSYWKDEMRNELIRCNKESKYRISFLWGTAFLRKEDGKLKTISNWKYEANQQLMKEKGWHRERRNRGDSYEI